MKLWKIIIDRDREVWRSIPVPVETESQEDILDVLGLSNLAGTGQLFVYPAGFLCGGQWQSEIVVFCDNCIARYVYTY